MASERIRLLHSTTVPQTLWFLRGQAAFMRQRGLSVRALSSAGPALLPFAEREKTRIYTVEMARRITPLQDLLVIFRMWRKLRKIRPEIVHAHTPKAGLLTMISACLAGVPVRVYHIHGLPMVTATGLRRVLLRLAEKVSCRLAHRVFCVSNSVANQAVQEKLCPAHKMKVLANGSINGVDAKKLFNRANIRAQDNQQLRKLLGIPDDATVLGFVGRIVLDKGVVELHEAWQQLRQANPNLYLLFVGPHEMQNAIPEHVRKSLESDPRVRFTGMTPNPVPYYSLIDILCVPTHREGFGMVFIEASAMEIPVIATRIPGCIDAVRDGVTGTLIPPKNAAAVAAAVQRYIDQPELRRRHGQAGREWVLQDFDPARIHAELHREYLQLLQER